MGGDSDHGGVVSDEGFFGWKMDFYSLIASNFSDFSPEGFVGQNSPASNEGLDLVLLEGFLKFAGDGLESGGLKRGGEGG